LKSRILSACLAVGVLAFGSAGAFAAVGHVSAAGKSHHHAAKHKAKKAKRHHARHHRRAHHAAAGSHAATAPASSAAPASAAAEGRSAAAQEYGTRPGKGCGDKNHEHTGPPGNPSNTSCPPHS